MCWCEVGTEGFRFATQCSEDSDGDDVGFQALGSRVWGSLGLRV